MSNVTVRAGVLAAIAITMSLAGCSGDGDNADEPTPSETSSSAAPQQSLSDVCEEIEATMPASDFGFPTEPAEREAFTAYAVDLREMAAGLDEESADVVDDLADSVDEVAEETDGLEASEEIDEAVDDVRDDCAAAGAPIFQ